MHGMFSSCRVRRADSAQKVRHRAACRFEAWMPILGAVVTVIVFVALPTYFYKYNYPHLNNCGADVTRYL